MGGAQARGRMIKMIVNLPTVDVSKFKLLPMNTIGVIGDHKERDMIHPIRKVTGEKKVFKGPEGRLKQRGRRGNATR